MMMIEISRSIFKFLKPGKESSSKQQAEKCKRKQQDCPDHSVGFRSVTLQAMNGEFPLAAMMSMEFPGSVKRW